MPEQFKPKVCPVCGREFTPEGARQVYCRSEPCLRARNDAEKVDRALHAQHVRREVVVDGREQPLELARCQCGACLQLVPRCPDGCQPPYHG